MNARDKFVGIQADYWDCRDAQQLTHDDPISALEEYVDLHLEPGCNVEKEIHEMGDVSMNAHLRSAVNEEDITEATRSAIESACEYFTENYGLDADGDNDCGLDPVKHRPAFEAAVRALYSDTTVWRCEIMTTIVLTPDEVLELMCVARPDWFEPSTQ